MPEYPLMSLERKIRQWKREKGVNVKEKGRKRKEKLKTEVKGGKTARQKSGTRVNFRHIGGR
jgi:hypothetical protein